jgi:hypothetical protein
MQLYYIINKKNFNAFTRWCFDEIHVQTVRALMEQDFGDLSLCKSPRFPRLSFLSVICIYCIKLYLSYARIKSKP